MLYISRYYLGAISKIETRRATGLDQKSRIYTVGTPCSWQSMYFYKDYLIWRVDGFSDRFQEGQFLTKVMGGGGGGRFDTKVFLQRGTAVKDAT